MEKRTPRLKKVVERTLRVLRRSRFGLYSCKHSKRVFTRHQLVALLVLREFTRSDYRGLH